MDGRGNEPRTCSMCDTALAVMYCTVCHVDLCTDCVEQHSSNNLQDHNVVLLDMYIPKCQDHSTIQCKFHCERCEIPICGVCTVSKTHRYHTVVDFMENYKNKQNILRRDLQELEKSILPRCQEASSNILVQKTSMSEHSQKLKTILDKQGEALKREIDTITQDMQSEIDFMDSKYLTAVEKQENEINCTTKEVNKAIQDIQGLLHNDDACLVSKYKSRNGKLRKLPLKVNVTCPKFQPKQINKQYLCSLFGSLSPMYLESVERSYTLQSLNEESSVPDKPMLDVPRVMKNIDTGYKGLYSISRLSDEEIWTCGSDNILRLYNLQGELVKSIQTESRFVPWDITVTRSGDLLCIDYFSTCIYIVKNTKTEPLIRLLGWIPGGVHITSSGDLLVSMESENHTQAKVVRYSGLDFEEKQSIQWNDHGYPLYSSTPSCKYLTEDRNLDICVADLFAHAVVVVNAVGKLRFRYTGPIYQGSHLECFPVGIATDSHGRILIADTYNYSIHILDQDSQFLHYFNKVNDNFYLNEHYPWGLCVDSRDNICVCGYSNGKVMKIQYLQ